RLERSRAEPKPLQKPHPPLIVGGAGGPRAARLAARWADEYNTSFATVEQCRERSARVAEACRRAGREPIVFSAMLRCCVGRDARETLRRAARQQERMGGHGDPAVLLAQENMVVGEVDEVVARLRAYGAAGVERVFLQHLD